MEPPHTCCPCMLGRGAAPTDANAVGVAAARAAPSVNDDATPAVDGDLMDEDTHAGHAEDDGASSAPPAHATADAHSDAQRSTPSDTPSASTPPPAFCVTVADGPRQHGGRRSVCARCHGAVHLIVSAPGRVFGVTFVDDNDSSLLVLPPPPQNPLSIFAMAALIERALPWSRAVGTDAWAAWVKRFKRARDIRIMQRDQVAAWVEATLVTCPADATIMTVARWARDASSDWDGIKRCPYDVNLN